MYSEWRPTWSLISHCWKWAFGVCAPQLWNALPMSMRSLQSFKDFKNVLKTHLFTEALNNVLADLVSFCKAPLAIHFNGALYKCFYYYYYYYYYYSPPQ
jgi:hypothetical protein